MLRKALAVATFAATAAAALTPVSASAQWQGYGGGYQRYNDYAGGNRYGDDGRPRWMYGGSERNGSANCKTHLACLLSRVEQRSWVRLRWRRRVHGLMGRARSYINMLVL